MADPRINLFSIKPCGPETIGNSAAAISSSTSDRKRFFGALGKVGDLEVLNDIGAGTIGKGLRTLSSISNTIRQGCGSLPTSIGGALGGGLDGGANWVLDHVGIARTAVDAASSFHPAIANQGLGQAKVIFEKVKQGNFKTSDIPGVLQDIQNLERLGRNIFTPSATENKTLMERCEASPYALDLISRAPKYKFLFVVQFVFNNPYDYLADHDFAFMVKRSTRPSVNFQMEDLNFYNFRSKTPTKTDFEIMDMAFYDDNLNNSTMFYKLYTEAMSPITNRQSMLHPELSGLDFTRANTGPATREDIARDSVNGTFPNFNVATNGTAPDSLNSSSLGPLRAARAGTDDQSVYNVSIIKEIKLFHVYDYGKFMNVYRFFTPRITNLVQDGLDMSNGSEGSEMSLKFAYDSVYIDASVPMNSSDYAITDTQRGALYPLRYNDGTGDAARISASTPAPPKAGENCGATTNTKNPPPPSDFLRQIGGGIGTAIGGVGG